MDQRNIVNNKLQEFSRILNEFTGIPLFVEIPVSELDSLTTNVSNEDSFRARITDLCNILDRINKRTLDRFTGVSSKGSRECLTNLLKKILPNDHAMIDQKFDEPIGMILLFRAYSNHRKNRNINKASGFFNIELPIVDYGLAWSKIFARFCESIDFCIEMLNIDAGKIDYKQDEIDEQIKSVLLRKIMSRYHNLIEEADIKRLLLYIMSEGHVIDTDLSRIFNIEISAIRASLLPLVPTILKVSYIDSETTEIKINEVVLASLKELYFKEFNT